MMFVQEFMRHFLCFLRLAFLLLYFITNHWDLGLFTRTVASQVDVKPVPAVSSVSYIQLLLPAQETGRRLSMP